MEYLLVVRWLLAFAVLGGIAYPLTARIFRGFPAGGIGFSPVVALAVSTTVALWVGRVAYGDWTAWLGVGALLLVSAAALPVGVDRKALVDRRIDVGDLRGVVDLEWITERTTDPSAATSSAVVFLAAFLFVVAIRAADPAVVPVGGEKFLDYGLLRSILRAETLPPTDVWFAGEPLTYYYGGHLAVALVATLTGTPPAYAYNLGLAGAYACLVAGAFDLARAIAADRGLAERGAARAGALAAVLVGLASNLVPAIGIALRTLPDPAARTLAGLVTTGGPEAAETLLADTARFHYWTASRVIDGTINEFPLFAFLNGDLHAHMLGAPFLLFGTAVAYAYWRTPQSSIARRRGLLVGVVVPFLGTLAVIHTWDLPTLLGVCWLALAFAPASPVTLLPGGDRLRSVLRSRLDSGPLRTEIERTSGALAVTVVLGALGFVLAAPFLLSAGGQQTPALVDPADRSALGALVRVHGVFLAGFLLYLLGRFPSGRLPLVGGVLALAVAGVLVGVPAVALVGPILVLGWVASRTGRDVGFETTLVLAGAGLVGLVEFVHLSELAGPGRLNTVFKIYFNVWVLWGVALGVVLALAYARGFSVPATRSKSVALLGGVRARLPDQRAASRVVVVVLVVSVLPYAAFALGGHFAANDAGTLDATAHLEENRSAEAAGIRWLDAHATREDVLLAAPGATRSPEGLAEHPGEPGPYTWEANPASSFTGIPTVAGWDHQVGYRGTEAYYGRVADVDRAYAGSDAERVAVLREYDVRYVWVGPGERARYGEDVSIGDLRGVEIAFETDGVRIYRVDHDRLAA
ncbi:DUF2298 domain-containing protein [Halopenitus salinus]|uniref:DUF2298 domain-containing protein n=1 Tax=Halopenitus salinus TaxID=1198295 RepID=A0ABD5UNX4_9EURY